MIYIEFNFWILLECSVDFSGVFCLHSNWNCLVSSNPKCKLLRPNWDLPPLTRQRLFLCHRLTQVFPNQYLNDGFLITDSVKEYLLISITWSYLQYIIMCTVHDLCSTEVVLFAHIWRGIANGHREHRQNAGSTSRDHANRGLNILYQSLSFGSTWHDATKNSNSFVVFAMHSHQHRIGVIAFYQSEPLKYSNSAH